jgi:hypothetical protein
MAEMPMIEQMAPASGGVGEPSSGSYGEKQQVADLEAALPPMEQPTGQPAPRPVPPMAPGMLAPQSGGLPKGMMLPSRRPEEAPGAPLSMQAPMPSTTPEQRIAKWHEIASNPNNSEEFRRLARMLLEGS